WKSPLHDEICVLRDSASRFLRMTKICDGINKKRHPEEHPKGASRRTHGADPAALGGFERIVMTDNPFFEAWDTPFGLPPFARIDPSHFPAAFDRGMAEQGAEVAAIADSAEPPDFANTVEALERSGALLRRVSRVFHNLD